MQPILIGLAGRARTGKDTLAAHLRQAHQFETVALADPIKDAVAAMLGITRAELDSYPKEAEIQGVGASPRKLFQTLGTEWGREMIGRDLWLTLAERHWMSVCRRRDSVGLVVTDVRMPNEAAWVRRLGGVVIHIERAGRSAVRQHVSEIPLPVLNGDFRMRNDSTIDELYRRADDLMRLVRIGRGHEASPNRSG